MMKFYLLIFVSFMLLFFAMPKNNAVPGFAQRAEIKKPCSNNKRFGKKPCTTECLKHQPQSGQQKNAAGIASDCNQQVYALANEHQVEAIILHTSRPDVILPHIRKHLSPVLEYDPEPPRLS